MKKKRKHSQLLLSVEKLRDLRPEELKDAAGGMCNTTDPIACSNLYTRTRFM